ncbi:carcinoembryonic antigen-related cell adhesion molecule 5-like [Cyprinodon tularosa]|uniref:carcinoembryonic antigen-related cell adhesion molecule 5-like n=1 Tax=Cyprinodon tularosa TaxID=77115 RepID=UPI0018E284D1|nr:carcinoembryonic antigen-related cell adhesion molecule 5-like [Cyprinodon tularosa]
MLRLLFIVAVAFTGLCTGSGVLQDGPFNATVGGKVLIKTNLNPTETSFTMVNWHFGVKSIISSQSESNITVPEYEGRITLFRSTGSLELRDLKLSDSGEYRVNIFPAGELPKEGETTLGIYEPVSDVTVFPPSADLVEFNSSVHLSCSSSSGSSLSFRWLNSSSEVTPSDRVQITDGGATLTIVNVTRYDQGSYSCNVSNPVSSISSDPVKISISYGPDNVRLEVNPPGEHHKTGSDIILTCSVDSTPSAEYQWFLNGGALTTTGPELSLMKIQMSQSGNYSCQAFNSKTQRYQRSLPSAVYVHDPVFNVKVTQESSHLIEFSKSASFFCSSSGSSLSFRWMKDSSEITASDRVQITDGGCNLTIVNVTRNDEGSYGCEVSNPASNANSDPVFFSVSYGPEKITLKVNPESQKPYVEGSDITLSCSADSRPPATFYWLLNEKLLPDSEHELKLISVQRNQSGNYSCWAFNNKTSVYQTSQLTSISIVEKQPSLSGGAIAGIVIACLVVAVAGATGGFFIYKEM